MQLAATELAFFAQVRAAQAQLKQAAYSAYDPAFIREVAEAAKVQRAYGKGIIEQMERDFIVKVRPLKEAYDLFEKVPTVPYVDHTMFHARQDKLTATVKAEVARQLQERDDDSEHAAD